MDDILQQHYELQSKELRVKIKTWEAQFQKEHNGNKPSKDDIKRNPKIAATYKEYQKARNVLDGKIPPPRPGEDDGNQRKRKSPNPPPSFTPSTKRYKQAQTPSSRNHHHDTEKLGQYTPGGAMTAVTPSLSRKLFSPVVPTSIGPTPQRDGRVLGIFDHLPFKDAEIDSPCRPNASINVVGSADDQTKGREVAVEETPKKSKTTDAIILGRTPSSRHKHQRKRQHDSPRKSLLATPLKPHDGNRVAKTPSTSSSVSRLQFATPAFLRRIPTAKITENSDYVSPEPIRLPRKPLLRGLSSVVADLRKLQEEQLDDDLDALHEMENEVGGSSNISKTRTSPRKDTDTDPSTLPDVAHEPELVSVPDDEEEAAILAADHDLSLLGGFDDENKFDNPDSDEGNAGLDRDGRPLKVYKKKGQKRTTRKANMRPVRSKRPTNTNTAARGDHEEHDEKGQEQEHEESTTATRQRQAYVAQKNEEEEDLLSGSDFAAPEGGQEADSDEDELALDMPPKTTKITSRKSIRKPGSSSTAAATTESKPEGPIKKTTRKVNELAHANFRRLKLRNNGAKGGPGYNSRFRRRR